MGIIYHRNIAIVDNDTNLSKWVVEHDTLEVAKADCLATFGPGYPRECNPGLGIFIRT